MTSNAETLEVPAEEEEQSENERQSLSTPFRRSARRREKPERLTYFHLGNPLSYVVQSLFQGLSTALVNSLDGAEDLGISSLTSDIPLKACKGACIVS